MDPRMNTVLTSCGDPLSRIRYLRQREGRKQNTNCVLTISAQTAIHFSPYRQTTPCIQTVNHSTIRTEAQNSVLVCVSSAIPVNFSFNYSFILSSILSGTYIRQALD